jgi:hypothetical protein
VKPQNVRKKLVTAQGRLNDYNDLEAPKPPFKTWVRSKFGATVAERHGEKPVEVKVGKPYQRVQHRTANR